MKKIFALLAIILYLTAANAQKINEQDVPVIVKNAFAKMYPGVNKTQWAMDSNLYKTSFTNGKNKGSVHFDAAGKWTERETTVLFNSLPMKAIEYIRQYQKTEKLPNSVKITKATGEIQYKVEINDKIFFFTKDGEFIKN